MNNRFQDPIALFIDWLQKKVAEEQFVVTDSIINLIFKRDTDLIHQHICFLKLSYCTRKLNVLDLSAIDACLEKNKLHPMQEYDFSTDDYNEQLKFYITQCAILFELASLKPYFEQLKPLFMSNLQLEELHETIKKCDEILLKMKNDFDINFFPEFKAGLPGLGVFDQKEVVYLNKEWLIKNFSHLHEALIGIAPPKLSGYYRKK